MEAARYREVIVEKLAAREASSSICPSEVARDAAQDLAHSGTVIITQGSDTVDLETVKGPIRIRRGPNW
ncbi:DUF3253 domain-containing protein [Corynebacterium afermentans subsp. lipophilum]|uniref:DUF3253 domain-containing protein n=1 Tax=Corynebacterium afermentans TaxID=38286 RepID=UPI00188BD217|nr:DUF3253 domain-containing protein [Corynebacterium afermentans]MBF4547757.1 DUF3253 domain-containing protein [Corynebacterium afermentans subsp. lipophilum]WJY58528.1 hypothetical protein CAFEL_03755 [Corynebacterium afermentans subsp. lipophilum]